MIWWILIGWFLVSALACFAYAAYRTHTRKRVFHMPPAPHQGKVSKDQAPELNRRERRKYAKLHRELMRRTNGVH